MTPLRRFALTAAPFIVSGACAQLIGLSDYEKGEVTGGAGEGDDGGEGGDGGTQGGNGGTSGQGGATGGRGGSRTGGRGGMIAGGEGGDSGEGGMGGDDPKGGQGGSETGGAGPRGGVGGGGMGGTAGIAGGGVGGSAGGTNCSTVSVPFASANFDQDTSSWIPYSGGASIPIIVAGASLGITADTAPNVAHLAGAHSLEYSGQFQPITIPAGAVTMTLTGFRQAITEEDPDSETVYDDMAIQMWEDALNPVTGTGVGEFAYFSNLDPTNGWTMFTGTVAVSTYAGQTVDLDMWGFTDDTLITDFYLDSLALTALVCQ
jgi:hypothetical protein